MSETAIAMVVLPAATESNIFASVAKCVCCCIFLCVQTGSLSSVGLTQGCLFKAAYNSRFYVLNPN